MRSGILFVSRKSRGVGGMQQLSNDLWCMIQGLYPDTAQSIVIQSLPAYITLLPRVLWTARKKNHVHLGDSALAPIAWILSKMYPNLQITVTACGLDITYQHPLYQWMLLKTLPKFESIVCISNQTAKEVMIRSVDPECIVTIPCGIWPSEMKTLSQKPSVPILLTVGRLIRRKGVAWFIEEVLPLLIKTHPNLLYKVVGEGRDALLISGIVKRLNLGNSVQLLGSISDEDRDDLYQKSNLFIMPNIEVENDIEGFGIVCIEASACGLPVAAARIEGVKDAVIENKTGMFFTHEDPISAATVIQEMLAEPFDRNEVARCTRAKYSWDELATHYAKYVFKLPHRHSDVGLRRSEGRTRETAGVAS